MIFRKDHLARDKDNLALHYRELTEALKGGEPDAGMAEHYRNNVPDFQKYFTDIDMARLDLAIAQMKTFLTELKKIRSKKVQISREK